MCDYSLHLVSSRPAEAGETIVVTGFSGTDTRGFASPLDPTTAVCLRPGTEIVFDQDARLDGRLFRRNINERLARFRQIDMDRPTCTMTRWNLPMGAWCSLQVWLSASARKFYSFRRAIWKSPPSSELPSRHRSDG